MICSECHHWLPISEKDLVTEGNKVYHKNCYIATRSRKMRDKYFDTPKQGDEPHHNS